MIRSKLVKIVPDEFFENLAGFSAREFEEAKPHLSRVYSRSWKIWVFWRNEQPMCVIGLYSVSLVGTGAEWWFLLCNGFHLSALRYLHKAMRRMVERIGRTTVKIPAGERKNEKFVKFLGFTPVEKCDSYTSYELRASWLSSQ